MTFSLRLERRWIASLLACVCGLFSAWAESVPAPQWDHAPGLFEQPFALQWTNPAAGVEIYYTTDGSPPVPKKSARYTAPIDVRATTLLRAIAVKEGAAAGSSTHSYLFLPAIAHQQAPAKLPQVWNGYPAVFAMDPSVQRTVNYDVEIRQSLRSLPIVSIVCKTEDLFGANKGLYVHSEQRGKDWEIPVSLEFLTVDGTNGFQVDCGMRAQGNSNRIPFKSLKHSFRVLFKKQYGPGTLHYKLFPDSEADHFNGLVMRADYNDSWVHWSEDNRQYAQRVRDGWMKDSQRALGWVGPHNRYFHLFLNGLYWGVYDFTERPDEHFASTYFGGETGSFDVLNENEVKAGKGDIYAKMNRLPVQPAVPQFAKLSELLEMDEYMDYLLLHIYAGHQDWGEEKNWYAIRGPNPESKFRFFAWDGEKILENLNDNILRSPQVQPFSLFLRWQANPEFRLRFADRAYKHLFNGGALTPAAVRDRWVARIREVQPAMLAESARWGGYRRQPPYSVESDWMREQGRLLQDYFPKRTQVVIQQLKEAGLYPSLTAPQFSRKEGKVPAASEVAIKGNSPIYFTLDGSDPRKPGGEIAAGAKLADGGVKIEKSTLLKARAYDKGKWSALAEARFDIE